MDAFSLALIYGTQGIQKNHKLLLATIVGLYHLIMPLIGLTIGKYIENRIIFNSTIVVGIILSLIAIEMIISSFKEKEEKWKKIVNIYSKRYDFLFYIYFLLAIFVL